MGLCIQELIFDSQDAVFFEMHSELSVDRGDVSLSLFFLSTEAKVSAMSADVSY